MPREKPYVFAALREVALCTGDLDNFAASGSGMRSAGSRKSMASLTFPLHSLRICRCMYVCIDVYVCVRVCVHINVSEREVCE